MFEEFWPVLRDVLGVGEDTHPSISQMLLRTVLVYIYALILVRIAQTRFLGENTAFDAILGFILGSILSRAITGNAPFVAVLLASALLIGLHWLLAIIAFRNHGFASLVKGDTTPLVEDGQIRWDKMRQTLIGERDLYTALRSSGKVEDLERVKDAFLERNGQISVITSTPDPQIVEINVEEGVQTVRVVLNG